MNKPTSIRLHFSVLTLLLVAMPFHTSAQATANESQRPNVILIMADDLGRECVGAYGGTSYQTPNIDKLSQRGLRFTRAYATPICTPTRVQIMSGQYPFRNGWDDGIWKVPGGYVSPDLRTFGHVFRDAGYRTAVVGKWQLAKFDEHPDHARQCGFDQSFLWIWQADGKLQRRYWKGVFWSDGERVDAAEDEYGPDLESQYVADFIKAQDGTQPFFLYFTMLLPHWPMTPTPESETGLDELTFPYPEENLNYQDHVGDPAHFGDMVKYMDRQIGQLTDLLDQQGLTDNTIIIFTGDNGTAENVTSQMNGRSIRGEKGEVTEPGIHVPLIVVDPRTDRGGQATDRLVDLSDILPTMVAMTGITDGVQRTIDGRSFGDEFGAAGDKPREWVYAQRAKKAAVIGKRWKLLFDGRLFDLQADPFEQNPFLSGAEPKEASDARNQLLGVVATLDGAPAFINSYRDTQGKSDFSKKELAAAAAVGLLVLIIIAAVLVRAKRESAGN